MSDSHGFMVQQGSNLCVCGYPRDNNIHVPSKMPVGRFAPRIGNIPVAEPTLTESNAQGEPRKLVVNWPDGQPDVCLVARAVLIDLVEQVNKGAEWEQIARITNSVAERWREFAENAWDELCEWHHEDCEGPNDPRPRADSEPYANCSCRNILLRQWRDITDADEWGDPADEEVVGE